MQLVVEGRVDVRRDAFVERPRSLAAEQDPTVGDCRAAHAELLATARQQLTALPPEALGADLRLAVAPALITAGERAVVRVPDCDRAGIELRDELRSDCVLMAVPLIDGLVHPVKLAHRDRVEADTGPGRRDRVRERRQE